WAGEPQGVGAIWQLCAPTPNTARKSSRWNVRRTGRGTRADLAYIRLPARMAACSACGGRTSGLLATRSDRLVGTVLLGLAAEGPPALQELSPELADATRAEAVPAGHVERPLP